MLKLNEVIPPFRWELNVHELPLEHRPTLLRYGHFWESKKIQETPCCYCLLLDFSLLTADITPDEEVEAWLRKGPDGSASYPFKDWKDYHAFFADYLQWLLMLRYVAANLPADIVAENNVAVEVTIHPNRS
jgi:hypothetical protein